MTAGRPIGATPHTLPDDSHHAYHKWQHLPDPPPWPGAEVIDAWRAA